MTDSMKFGPEWLRNMSNDNLNNSYSNNNSNTTNASSISVSNVNNSTIPRYQLAEYRYGREEMLSLYDKNAKDPEILKSYKKLFVEKLQCPLALIPTTTDDDVPPVLVHSGQPRPWNVLRSPVFGGVGGVSSGTSIRGTGRGGSVDRGRNRTRGGSSGSGGSSFHALSSYQRPTALYDEDIRSKIASERGWHERNGNNDSTAAMNDWNGSPSSSPRKEFASGSISHNPTSAGSRGGGNMENWRRTRIDEDSGNSSIQNDGWRGNTSTGTGSSYRWTRSTSWREDEGITPNNNNENSTGPLQRSYSSTTNTVDHRNNGTSVSIPPFLNNRVVTKQITGINVNAKGVGEHDEAALPEWAMANPTDSGGSFDATGAFHDDDDDVDNRASKNIDKKESEVKTSKAIAPLENEKSDEGGSNENSSSNNEETKPVISKPPKEIESLEVADLKLKNCTIKDMETTSKKANFEISDDMQEIADDMVAKLITDYEETTVVKKSDQIKPTPPIPPISGNSSSIMQKVQLNKQIEHQKQISNASIISSQQSTQSSSNDLWYYRDPQGKVQGSFTAAEMAEWYRAGYFDENLYVRRFCDARFAALGELVKLCGNSMPFLSSHLIPPLTEPQQIIPKQQQQQQQQHPLGNNNARMQLIQPMLTPPPPQQQQQMVQHQMHNLISAPGMAQQQPIGGIVSSVNANLNKNIINPLLSGPNNIESITLIQQFHFLQKQFYLKKRAQILHTLSSADSWNLLSLDQQQQILNQRLAQINYPDYLLNLQTLSSTLAMTSPISFSLHQVLAAAKNEIIHTKITPNWLYSSLGIGNGGSCVDGPLFNNNDFSNNSSNDNQTNLHNLIAQATGTTQPSAPQPPSQIQSNSTNMLDNDPIKSLYLQLQLQKNAAVYAALGNSNTNPSNHWSGNLTQPQQHLAQPWASISNNNQQNIASLANPTTTTTNDLINQNSSVYMWDFGRITQPTTKTTEMKTEQTNNDESLVNSTTNKNDKFDQLLPQHEAELTKKDSNKKLSTEEEKKPQISNQNNQQKDDDFIKIKSNSKNNKKEKKHLSEEDRKREQIEEKRKQKEERKRQQIDEERKQRYQAQLEGEKRRELIEDEKRQKDTELQQRRVLMETYQAASDAKQKQQQRTTATPAVASVSSIAPWSNSGLPGITTPGPNFAEIQKAERERRSEEQRLEQILETQRKSLQMETVAKDATVLKWNSTTINVKSLSEIQAEETKRLASEHATQTAEQNRRKEQESAAAQAVSFNVNNPFNTIWNSRTTQNIIWNGINSVANIVSGGNGGGSSIPSTNNQISNSASNQSNVNNNNKTWGSASTSSSGFWEEPTKIVTTPSQTTNKQQQQQRSGLIKSQTVSSMPSIRKELIVNNTKQSNQMTLVSGGNKTTKVDDKSTNANSKKKYNPSTNISSSGSGASGNGISGSSNTKKDDARNEFTSWCVKGLSSIGSAVDVPTFISFLQDIESPFEVKEYIRVYLGESKDCTEFGKQFLERRSKYKNQQRAQNAHIDDMCAPAPAINPSSNDFQENKGKKLKKNKMTKLDARILGFSVTAAQDRINVGDRDYGDAS